jgi:CheY-like chemotaxis protein
MLQSNQPITGTILVADDQVANRELFHELLTSHGFLILEAADGAEALRQVEKGNVDLRSLILAVHEPVHV